MPRRDDELIRRDPALNDRAGRTGEVRRMLRIVDLAVPLGLTLLETTLVVLVYRVVIGWQGMFLQALEQRILETVAARAE